MNQIRFFNNLGGGLFTCPQLASILFLKSTPLFSSNFQGDSGRTDYRKCIPSQYPIPLFADHIPMLDIGYSTFVLPDHKIHGMRGWFSPFNWYLLSSPTPSPPHPLLTSVNNCIICHSGGVSI